MAALPTDSFGVEGPEVLRVARYLPIGDERAIAGEV
jgi:hypothetical protein